VPKTLLAVDDSATMRRVLEITFSGEDFKVITAEGAQSALGKLAEEPRVVVIDTSLGGDDGYALCKEIRRRDSSAALILLSSRHNPYDQAKGRDAGADDYMDKPFDTQQMIDKVRKVLLAHESGAAQPAAGAAHPHRDAPAPTAPATPAARAPAAPADAQRPAAHMADAPRSPPVHLDPPKPVSAVPKAPARGNTLMFGEPGSPAAPPVAPSPSPGPVRPMQSTAVQSFVPRPPPAAERKAPDPPAPPAAEAHKPAPAPTPPTAVPGPPRPAAAAHAPALATNGQLAGKLGELGLSPAQVDAVLALSREVVERVVWEVVPQLAETLIKEEIARLTKEG
jgi:CheY-like chemotaxis protein